MHIAHYEACPVLRNHEHAFRTLILLFCCRQVLPEAAREALVPGFEVLMSPECEQELTLTVLTCCRQWLAGLRKQALSATAKEVHVPGFEAPMSSDSAQERPAEEGTQEAVQRLSAPANEAQEAPAEALEKPRTASPVRDAAPRSGLQPADGVVSPDKVGQLPALLGTAALHARAPRCLH